MTEAQVIVRRLARSHLLSPAPPTRAIAVVGEVALLQAQVLSAAVIGLGVRVREIGATDVDRALYERRTLIKTWSIRGTLHLVPAAEAPMWAAAWRGPSPDWDSAEWRRATGVTPAQARLVLRAFAEALDGRCLTRAELADAVRETVPAVSRARLMSGWGELLQPAAAMGILCFGPPRGSNVTFVRADQWIGQWQDVDPDDARNEVLRRYLRVHGPAGPDDFRRWSGFSRDAVRAIFKRLAHELTAVRFGPSRLWLPADDDGDLRRSGRCVHLLPKYDAFIIGFRPRELLMAEPVREAIRRDPKGRFESVTGIAPVVVDGRVTGLWRRKQTRNRIEIDIDHVMPFPNDRKRDLEAAVERVRAIAGG